ncbi:DUF2252 domain-containing protein [Nocardioides panacisoli]|uniref:DUF2252 domain-containing protein n=1 Tax=Nocardioides panacisoli TaxID=627624 RepID=UPI001C631A65|nr:DUF2252 domain-containing protein [Nocardioides panacisoli]QYJ03034.1 DUF2252 domain-containing protein [Nocardioides panacisoli]
MPQPSTDRRDQIVAVLDDAFADLMERDPAAFRTKFRKMAADPHSFYRGTACLFYADVVPAEDPFATGESGRIWVHGDLHVENFGTYLNSDGLLVFDVNDFDEAYLGRFTWDLQRFAASLALLGWQKALPRDAVVDLLHRYLDAYLDQVDAYADTAHDEDFALHLGNTDGPIRAALGEARAQRRSDLLDANTDIVEGHRRFRDDPTVRRLDEDERATVLAAFEEYLGTIPEDKRFDRDVFYDVLDVVGKSGFGIGSAGLPAYNILVEGYSQAFENDVLLSMKQGNVPAVSRYVDAAAIEDYFVHEGQRTVVSQRALQVHTDPLLGHTRMDGAGFVVHEVSPFEVDLDWSDLTEPEEMAAVVGLLGRATAKVHCAADEDSEHDLVEFQVEDAIRATLEGRRSEFRDWVVDFGLRYADQVRADHAAFVEAFRDGDIGIAATSS